MENDYTSFKLDLVDELKAMDIYHIRGRDQYSIRCPMCGDSRKHRSSSHFYVRIEPYADTPVLCHCFLCNAGGLLTPTMLKHMDILDIDMNSGLTSLNKHISRTQSKYSVTSKRLNHRVPPPIMDKSDEGKRKYISKRLGIDFTYDELVRLKTIFSLQDFVTLNKIEDLTVHMDKAHELNDSYVGFLTMHNEFINFRKVYKSRFKRYEKYSVENGLLNTVRFYTIPTKLDILTSDMIEINIAEGVFDILGVYYHIDNGGRENSVYSAVTGSDYMSVIDHYIREGFVGNVIINIYSDSEVPHGVYNRIVRSYSDWVEEINVYYNKLDDDFGVPKDRIELDRKRLF